MIEFKNVSKKYDSVDVISNINLLINEGELVTLIGLSGCGKTTTLKMINRLIQPTNGDVLLNNKSIFSYNPIKLRRKIGFVIQQTGLFPHMSVRENIGIIPEAEGVPQESIDKKVKELMEMVDLDYNKFVDAYPDELSGGQQQRVGIARAFANDANVILMDEPFSALDPITKNQLQDELVKIQKETNKTIVFVTHDMNEAIKISDRICIMNKGEIIQFDTPENIMRTPKNDFVTTFIGENKLWDSPELLKASDIMNDNPITISYNVTLFKAIEKLRDKKVEYLIVTNKDKLYKGYVRALDLRIERSSDQIEHYVKNDMYVTHVDTPVPELFDRIMEKDVSIIPVIDNDSRLVGTITKTSILLTFINHTLILNGGK